MTTLKTMWKKLAKDKKYREEFAVAMLKRMIPYQTRAIRKERGWSQAELAQHANVTQGVISRAEDPNYGNLTLTTIGRIAAGYDLAAIVKFVPFSELVRFSENMSEKEFANLSSFEMEHARQQTKFTAHQEDALPEIPLSLHAQPNKGTKKTIAETERKALAARDHQEQWSHNQEQSSYKSLPLPLSEQWQPSAQIM